MVSSRTLALVGGLWAIGVAIGIGWLGSYSRTAGPVALVPGSWPPESAIERRPGRPTLLLFAHPRCPCTRASSENFASLAREHGATADLVVLFVRPRGVEAGWEDTALRSQLAALPGVVALEDDAGREAARFGVATSGHVLLYDGGGRLAFSGGITAARGHAGESAARLAVSGLLAAPGAPPSVVTRAPVYGCGLFDPVEEACGASCCDVTTASVGGRTP